jgi:photosystem II stability/assembly factor-like uncharacterized protein
MTGMISHNRFSRPRVSSILLVLILLSMSSVMVPVAMASENVYALMQVSETTWELLESDYPDGSFWDVSFVNATHGWIVGIEIKVMYTPDGGTSWYEQSVPEDVSSRSPRIRAVDFINETHGWAVGSRGVILRLVPPTVWEVAYGRE